MFSIDFPEIVIILGVALVVLGPKKLPGAAAKIGRWVGRARTMARQFREQLEQEVSSAENAVDIRKTIDSVSEPARKQPPPAGAGADSPMEGAPPGEAPRESVPREAVEHGTPADEAHETNAAPYESGPYEMPPAEGYGPPPQQLTFDAQLHDTALPPEGSTSAPGMGTQSAESTDPREWMPETQTWMASAGWENTESAAPEQQVPAPPPRQTAAERPAPHDRAPEPADAPPSSRNEAVEHDDR